MAQSKEEKETENKVAAYLKKHDKWRKFLEPAREVMLSTELKEAVKWGAPAYTLNGKNLIGLTGFKNHCAIWFHNGVFLKDKEKKLVNAQEGTTKGLRQWRFEEGDKFPTRLVKSYVLETMDNARAGKAIKPEPKKLLMPTELESALGKSKRLEKAFKSLTPGRQKEYAQHIGSAKQEKTRLSRLEKAKPMILDGVGLNDAYKNC